MVFRRPYAFLIKYFRLIHIILFILFAYITFKANSILTFLKIILIIRVVWRLYLVIILMYGYLYFQF